jgi:protein ImuA
MLQPAKKNDVFEKLRREILSLEGYQIPVAGERIQFGLGPVEASFPSRTFPTGAIHEFISTDSESAAATTGFMAGLLGSLMRKKGICLWISNNRNVFPPALKSFGIEPDRIIFVDMVKSQDVLWAIEEALKCEGLAAVVGELREISFTESRRLQLAVEQSRVTGFLHRNNPRSTNTLACVSRWKITSVPSVMEDDMPGVGFPRWLVQLLKIRNGRPGAWQLEWSEDGFVPVVDHAVAVPDLELLKVG